MTEHARCQPMTESLRKQAFEMSCEEQYRLAFFIAENLGYVLAKEPEHPDSPHSSSGTAEAEIANQLEVYATRYSDDWSHALPHLSWGDIDLIVAALRRPAQCALDETAMTALVEKAMDEWENEQETPATISCAQHIAISIRTALTSAGGK